MRTTVKNPTECPFQKESWSYGDCMGTNGESVLLAYRRVCAIKDEDGIQIDCPGTLITDFPKGCPILSNDITVAFDRGN